MPRELKDTKHNAYHREASMKYYNTPKGRMNAKLKYLRTKYKDEPDILAIVNDESIDKMERIERVKILGLRVKMKKLQEKIDASKKENI